MRRLGQLTETVSRARVLPEIFEAALDCLRDTVGAERSAILLYDDAAVMRFEAWRGISDDYRAAVEGHSPWQPGEPDPQPIAIADTDASPDLADYRALFGRERIGALAFVPLVCAGTLLGKFMLYFDEPRELDDETIECARTVAAQVAFAVERHRAYAEARDAERRKDEFLAVLGHELRNPLAPIVTALQLMELQAPAPGARERRIINRQVQHLLRLIDDLLDVSRITRGKLELRRRRIEIAEVVEHAIEVASPLLEERKHRLEVRVPERGLVVFADPVRLGQVVSNLLTNAAKYTEPGGRVSVTAAAESGGLVLRVRDTGIGIEPALLPRLFDMFAQGHQSIDRAKGGLGLGLTIVQSLTALHGGVVTVHSDGAERGSTFEVRLPLVESTHEIDALADRRWRDEHAIASEARRVLVVDDNPDAADTLCDALAAAGHETAVAYDGPTALVVAERFHPQVALLDIGLPVMDGYELAQRLRQLNQKPPSNGNGNNGNGVLRLIAITGYGQQHDRARAFAAGFDAHFVKPVELRTLIDSLTASNRTTAAGGG